MPELATTSIAWNRPDHSRWLIACTTGLLLSIVVGGFSLAALAIFVVIFLVGFALLSDDGQDVADDDFWWTRDLAGTGTRDTVGGDPADYPETPTDSPSDAAASDVPASDTAEETTGKAADETVEKSVEETAENAADEAAGEPVQEDAETSVSGRAPA